MTRTVLVFASAFLAIAHIQMSAGQSQKVNASQPQTPLTPQQIQQQIEVLNHSKTIMDSVFLTIVDSLNSMDSLQVSLVTSLNMSYLAVPTTGVANAEVNTSMTNFRNVIQGLIGELKTSGNNLQLRIEALRMGMQTCHETLNQSFQKIRNLLKCTIKQIYIIMNQVRNCTFRALTACKSEVAIIQDGISDAFLEVHNINMRMAHCTLMNPKNAVPCIDVLTKESPAIIDNAKGDLPSYVDVNRILDGINKCSLKISQNVDTMCV